jgi:isopenicillin N synthase-like dioxygenase
MTTSTAAFGAVNVSEFFRGDPETKARIAREVDEICIRTGFLAITGHGVSPELIEELWAAARAFFARDTAAKQAYRASRAGTGFQYTLMGAEALARSKGLETPPDLKESVDMTPDRRNKETPAAGLDPETEAAAAKLEALMQEYYRQVAALSDRIMAIFATALKLPEDYFLPLFQEPMTGLRVIHYPATTVAAQKGQLRAGEHTDYGCLTVLLPQPNSGGLEILTREGRWEEVPPIPGAFVINIGDMLSMWTNNHWISTNHRVAGFDANGMATRSRLSIPLFYNPNGRVQVECLPTCLQPGQTPIYPPVSAGEYLMAKINATRPSQAKM